MNPQKRCGQVARITLIIVSFTNLSSAQDWDRMAKIPPGEPLRIIKRDQLSIDAVLRSLTPEVLVVERRKQLLSFPKDSVRQVLVKRKASRWKAVGIAAAVGFGIGFPIGVASSGYLSDQNSPSLNTRVGFGAGLGLIGAGIGAGLGALLGGTRYETVFRQK